MAEERLETEPKPRTRAYERAKRTEGMMPASVYLQFRDRQYMILRDERAGPIVNFTVGVDDEWSAKNSIDAGDLAVADIGLGVRSWN